MGQLQKRFENQAQAQFTESPEAMVSWKTSTSGSQPSQTTPSQQMKSTVPRWQIRALQWGAVVIVVLILILVYA